MGSMPAWNPKKKSIKLCTCEILPPGNTRNEKEVGFYIYIYIYSISRKVSLYRDGDVSAVYIYKPIRLAHGKALAPPMLVAGGSYPLPFLYSFSFKFPCFFFKKSFDSAPNYT